MRPRRLPPRLRRLTTPARRSDGSGPTPPLTAWDVQLLEASPTWKETMPTIEVSDQQAADIALLAQAWKTTPDVVIRRLLDRFKYPRPTASARHRDSVPVHAILRFKGSKQHHLTGSNVAAG